MSKKPTPEERKDELDSHALNLSLDLFNAWDAPLRDLRGKLQQDLAHGLLVSAFERLKFEFRRNELIVRIPLNAPKNNP